MSIIKQIVGTRTALTTVGLATLASGTYVASNAYIANTNQSLDVIVEVDAATTNAPVGNKQLCVFVQESLDGANFRSGPTSGTATADESNLRFLGALPMNTSSVTQIGTFSVGQALGFVPYAFKIILKNELGVALTSGAVFTSEISSTVA